MQFGQGGAGFVANQAPPAQVTTANNGLRLSGSTVQLGGPLPVGALLIEQDTFITIQQGIPNQRFGIFYDADPANQFLIAENINSFIIAMSSSDGAQFSSTLTMDPNTVTLSAADSIAGTFPSFSIDSTADRFIFAGAGGLVLTTCPRLITTQVPMTNGAGAAVGTLNNAPAAGNPTKWIEIDDNGTLRYIPSW